MILAWHKPEPDTLPCYSFGSMFRDCSDVTIARRVSKVCRQKHEVIAVDDRFLSDFPHYAERSVYLTDGCVDVSHSADLYVNERAAAIAPVRMTGNYGGEVLRRVRAFKPVDPLPDLLSGDLSPDVEAAKTTYRHVVSGHPLSFAVFRQAPWHHYGLLSLEQTQLALRSPFLDNDFVRTVFRAPQSACGDDSISLRLIRDGDERLARIPTDRGVRVCSESALSTAVQKLILFTIKAEYAYDYGMPQWVAQVDHLFSPLRLERLFLGRHKFYHYRVWYRDRLAPFIREMLLDSRTLSRAYLQRRTVEQMVRKHVNGDRNYTSEIHKVLTLELISRLFVDGK
jgi:asparagine synthase (glutamine-hydrolysing)